MQKFFPELVIDDPARIAIVQLASNWYDEKRWEIYIPNSKFQICFSMSGIGDVGMPEEYQSVQMPFGKSELKIRELGDNDEKRLQVTSDGKMVFDIKSPQDLNRLQFATTSPNQTRQSQQNDAIIPIVGYPVRNGFSSRPSDQIAPFLHPENPENKIILWIQSEEKTLVSP